MVWVLLTCEDSEERDLVMSLVIMGTNIAGVYSAQILRSDDLFRHRRASECGLCRVGRGLSICNCSVR